MSRSFLWSAIVVISFLAAGAVATFSRQSSATDTLVTSAVTIDPYEAQATIKMLPEQQFADLI